MCARRPPSPVPPSPIPYSSLDSPPFPLTLPNGNVILTLYEILSENSPFFGPDDHSRGGKTESWSMDGSERDRGSRRRRGMQKLSGKRIGSGRHFGKCGHARTPKGHPEAAPRRKGISQVRTEAERSRGIFLSLFLFPPSPAFECCGVILISDRNLGIFPAEFVPNIVEALDHICPLCSAVFALSGAHSARKS